MPVYSLIFTTLFSFSLFDPELLRMPTTSSFLLFHSFSTSQFLSSYPLPLFTRLLTFLFSVCFLHFHTLHIIFFFPPSFRFYNYVYFHYIIYFHFYFFYLFLSLLFFLTFLYLFLLLSFLLPLLLIPPLLLLLFPFPLPYFYILLQSSTLFSYNFRLFLASHLNPYIFFSPFLRFPKFLNIPLLTPPFFSFARSHF